MGGSGIYRRWGAVVRGHIFIKFSQFPQFPITYLGYFWSRPPWPAGPLWRTSWCWSSCSLVLGYLVPVSIKQDDFSHMIVPIVPIEWGCSWILRRQYNSPSIIYYRVKYNSNKNKIANANAIQLSVNNSCFFILKGTVSREKLFSWGLGVMD